MQVVDFNEHLEKLEELKEQILIIQFSINLFKIEDQKMKLFLRLIELKSEQILELHLI